MTQIERIHIGAIKDSCMQGLVPKIINNTPNIFYYIYLYLTDII